MSFSDFQEAVLIVFTVPVLQLGALAVAGSVLVAASMPLVTVAKLLYRRWRPK